MKITDVRVRTFGGKLEQVGHVSRGWSERHGLLLEVEDENGTVGIGEASPLPGYSPDTLEDAERDLQRWATKRMPPISSAPPIAIAATATSWLRSPAARFAAETAMLDLVARRRDVALPRLLGEPVSAVPLAALIDGDEPDRAAAQAEAAIARGIRTLKLKVSGSTLGGDIDRLAAVREAVGEEVDLRLDANGTLDPQTLAGDLDRLATYSPALIEEPVSGKALASVGRSPIPIAVDETLHAPGGFDVAIQAARRGSLTTIVLKPMVLGLVACLDTARRAAALGLDSYLTHSFDGPVALAAAATAALVMPRPRNSTPLACGLDRHRGLEVWPSTEMSWIEKDRIVENREPGLGITF
ncbi:MAG: mandelate racemase/muconate lactonizing enzyme family protein [Acidobacteriota bacterium]